MPASNIFLFFIVVFYKMLSETKKSGIYP